MGAEMAGELGGEQEAGDGELMVVLAAEFLIILNSRAAVQSFMVCTRLSGLLQRLLTPP